MSHDPLLCRPVPLRRAFFLAPLALGTATVLAALGGCGGGGSGDFDGDDDDDDDSREDEPRLRFVNATQDYRRLDISLDGESRPVIEGLAWGGGSTGYDWLSDGRHNFRMVSRDPSGEITGSERFSDRTYYSALAYGPRGDNARLLFLEESEPAPDNDETKIRALHLASPNGALDLYLTAPELTDLNGVNPVLSGLQYSQLGTFLRRDAERMALHLTAAGSKTPLFRVTFAPAGGSVLTLVLLRRDDRLNVTALPQRQAAHPLDNQLP